MVVHYVVHCGGDDAHDFTVAILGGVGATAVGGGGGLLLGVGAAGTF